MPNKVPLSAATTNTQMDSDTLNPTVKSAGGDRNRKIIHITLVCEGVNVTGDEIYDALDYLGETVTLGTGGSVTSNRVVAGEKTLNTRGTYIFNIGPA